jgi:hypothetical protein
MENLGNSQAEKSFTINEDGSITRSNNGGTQNQNGSSYNGCIWFIILAIITVVVVAFIINNKKSTHDADDATIVEDSTVVEEIVEADTVAADIGIDYATVSYLNVSDEDIYMNASGGEVEISVSTDGDWWISTDTESWGHTSSYGKTITLRLEKNSSSSTRTDYFVISAGDYTKRVNITQYGNTEPSADIENIWVDYNVYNSGCKGMKIHVKFSVNNMNGKTIYVYAYFYYADNTTELHDSHGNNLQFYGYGTSNYERCTFTDFNIFVPYNGLNMGAGTGSVNLSFDISIADASENQLTRNNNTSFQFSRGE